MTWQVQVRCTERAMPDRCMDHSRQPDVACEKETAIDLCRKVEAGESRGKFGFGRRGIFGGAFDLHRGRFGRIELRCIDHQIAECKLLVAMADEAANNFAFLPVDIPSRCRCHGEQGPCGGSSFAQGWLVSCQTSAICRGDEGVAAGEVFRQPTARIIGKTRQIGPERRPFRSERNIRVQAGRRRGLDSETRLLLLRAGTPVFNLGAIIVDGEFQASRRARHGKGSHVFR